MRMILNINENNEFMRLLIIKLFAIVATLLLCTFAGSSQTQNVDFMKVASRKIPVDDKLCYSVRKGYSWKDTTKWVPYCGVIKNLYHEDGFEYSLMIDKFDILADTICVVRTIASYKPRKTYKKTVPSDSILNKESK